MNITKQHTFPILLFILILCLGWLFLESGGRQENQKLEIKTQIVAEQVGIRLHEFLQTRLSRLDYFRDFVESTPNIKEADFRARSLLIQHEVTGFQAINFIDADGIFQWVTPLSSNAAVLGIQIKERGAKEAAEAFNRAFTYRSDSSTPLITLIQGGNGFAVYLPIVDGDEIRGFVNGVFRIEELIDQCLGKTVRDYNYEVILGGKSVYRRGETHNFEAPPVLGRYNFNILGQAWELQIVPGSSESKIPLLMRLITVAVFIIIASLVALFTYSKMKSQAQIRSAYEQIEKSELKFKAIFDKSPAGLLRFNRQGILTDWNRVAANLFSLEYPVKREHPTQELNCLTPLLPYIQTALDGRSSEYNGFVHVNDRRREIESAFEPLISTSDELDGGVILVKDVTEENQTIHAREVMFEIGELTKGEKDLSLLFESIQKSLSRVMDARNFYIALYSAETEEFTFSFFRDEFDSPPPTTTKYKRSLSAYVLNLGVPTILTKDQIYQLHGAGVIELRGTPAEQWVGAPLLVEAKPIGIMAIQSYSRDVIYDENDLNILRFVSHQIATTIKINLEDEKLRKSEALHRELSNQLGDSNNIKALLLDIITHDLKNPAGVISSVADMLVQEGNANDEIKLIKDSSDALLKVITNTSSIARITLGETISMSELNLSEIVVQVVEEFAAAFEMQGKPLENRITPDLYSKANPVIAEVFRNYLSNALKYAPENKAVQVILEDTGTEIAFLVKDQGRAIEGEDQTNIFERSVQLSNGISRGSGLGLAIVKRIAAVHGAQVGVSPDHPSGNIFYMKLQKIPHIDARQDSTERGLNE